MYSVKIILCIILVIIVDMPYLYLNADFFKKKTLQISGKKYPNNRIYSALVVYIAIALGIIVFVLPNIEPDTSKSIGERLKRSLLYGGLFGLISYAIFDFTNHFMFDHWDIYVSIMDTIWGGLLCAIVTFIISYY
jgi:uncharacterized membrane protein